MSPTSRLSKAERGVMLGDKKEETLANAIDGGIVTVELVKKLGKEYPGFSLLSIGRQREWVSYWMHNV